MGPSLHRDPKELGRYGEDVACGELERRGYVVLERRARSRVGEIDIVARDGAVLVFVEVKTRRTTQFGLPAEAVGWTKQRRLIRLAKLYAARKGWGERPVRFDVVGILVSPGGRPRVEVIRGAFQET